MVETIEKREAHIDRKIQNEITNAKKFSQAGKKREALQCIKKKKMREKQLEQIRCASTIGTPHLPAPLRAFADRALRRAGRAATPR